jgi:hypothetical protein
MANSADVNAGDTALASQYNDLRDDVLNTSSGHTHDGVAGKLITMASGCKIGNYQITSSGDLTISGVGFRPSLVILVSTGGQIGETMNMIGVGFDGGAAGHMCVYKTAVNSTGPEYILDALYSVIWDEDTTGKNVGKITSFNDDGFVFNYVTAFGTPSSTTIVQFIYIAFR